MLLWYFVTAETLSSINPTSFTLTMIVRVFMRLWVLCRSIPFCWRPIPSGIAHFRSHISDLWHILITSLKIIPIWAAHIYRSLLRKPQQLVLFSMRKIIFNWKIRTFQWSFIITAHQELGILSPHSFKYLFQLFQSFCWDVQYNSLVQKHSLS